mmetsp:Transcript_41467/g.125572  ORF Transcript_41467/g.125572 Transcript_41467/m.125572 type:complete len:244 (-) Transcript_41467:817-1548(-)
MAVRAQVVMHVRRGRIVPRAGRRGLRPVLTHGAGRAGRSRRGRKQGIRQMMGISPGRGRQRHPRALGSRKRRRKGRVRHTGQRHQGVPVLGMGRVSAASLRGVVPSSVGGLLRLGSLGGLDRRLSPGSRSAIRGLLGHLRRIRGLGLESLRLRRAGRARHLGRQPLEQRRRSRRRAGEHWGRGVKVGGYRPSPSSGRSMYHQVGRRGCVVRVEAVYRLVLSTAVVMRVVRGRAEVGAVGVGGV